MATPINAPMAGEIWHLSIEDLFQPVQEAPRLGGEGPFVINLSVSTAPISIPTKAFAACSDAHVYQIQVTEDGRTRYRLRLGPFATEDEADAILAVVRDTYPGALTATASASDLRVIGNMQAKIDSRHAGVQKPSDTAVTEKSVPQKVAAETRAAEKPAKDNADAEISIDIAWPTPELVVPPTRPVRAAPTVAPAAAPKVVVPPVAVAPLVLAPEWALPELDIPLPQSREASWVAKEAPVLTEVVVPAAKVPAPKIAAPTPPAAPVLTEAVMPKSKAPVAPALEVTAPRTAAPIAAAPARVAAQPAAPKPAAINAPATKTVAPVAAPPIAAAAVVVTPAPAQIAPIPHEPAPKQAAAPANPLPPKFAAPQPKIAAPPPKIAVPPPRIAAPPPKIAVPPPKIALPPPKIVAPPTKIAAKMAPMAAEKSAPVLTQSVLSHSKAATKLRQSAMKPSANRLTSLQHVVVATAPAPPAREVKKLDVPLESLESTQTMRALTPTELEDSEASRWFVIQLALADDAFDPDAVPNLDLFSEYRLYSVAGLDEGRVVHALRLGFFREEIGAVAVASYLAAYWDKPTIKRVSLAERERFADQRVEARKDIGATGRHAVIEITDELVARRRRSSKFSASTKTSNPTIGH
jgi:SPOR domain